MLHTTVELFSNDLNACDFWELFGEIQWRNDRFFESNILEQLLGDLSFDWYYSNIMLYFKKE